MADLSTRGLLALRLLGPRRGAALLSAGAAESRIALRLAERVGLAIGFLGPLAVWLAVGLPWGLGAAAVGWVARSTLLGSRGVNRGRAAVVLTAITALVGRVGESSFAASPVPVLLAALGLLAAGALLLRGALPMPRGRVAWLGAGGSIRLDDGWADVRATEDTPRGEVLLVERPAGGDPYRGTARVSVFPMCDLLACDAAARVQLGVGILALAVAPLVVQVAGYPAP